MKIGFIGLGNVGGKLAASLLRNNWSVMVRDLDRWAAEPLWPMGRYGPIAQRRWRVIVMW